MFPNDDRPHRSSSKGRLHMSHQPALAATPPQAGPLDRILALVDEARRGQRTEEATLQAIAQLIRKSSSPADTYQKPLG